MDRWSIIGGLRFLSFTIKPLELRFTSKLILSVSKISDLERRGGINLQPRQFSKVVSIMGIQLHVKLRDRS